MTANSYEALINNEPAALRRVRRELRQHRKELRAKNPSARRLGRLSDHELDRLELTLLRLKPAPDPYYMRLLEESVASHERRQRGALGRPPPEPPQALADPGGNESYPQPEITNQQAPQGVQRPAEAAPPPEPPPEAPTPLPANVVPIRPDVSWCGARVFGVGNQARWIGGETPPFPGGYGR
jgi:hypothetical protein